jgi:glutamate/tyrosine decarboxylase-like PLP-dependent enzyme
VSGHAARWQSLRELTGRALDLIEDWEAGFGAYEAHTAAAPDPRRLDAAWSAFGERMRGNHPFFHPRYAGQMLKPPHPVAVAGYLAAMLVNPNNHALDGGPATSELEKEVVAELAAMFGLPGETLGHLTASGTVANLEALWVARELHPGRAVAYSADAHYTHARMCGVLGIEGRAIASDEGGRMDLDALEAELRRGGIGTVVLTPGTTGLGAVDRVDQALALRDRHGVRLHADAAYGGFFALLAREPQRLVPAAPLRALAHCDSVVVDPHKHGLQPYGCGAVLFRDPGVGRLYRHDSPYTYFTSDELHLGEISLECSRAGAAAAALWLTLRALPLRPGEGLGAILAAGVRGARDWAGRIDASDELELLQVPELDIVAFLPATAERTASAVDRASQALFEAAAADPEDPVHLSVLRVPAGRLAGHEPDVPYARVLRSVLMKPEHELRIGALHERLSGRRARP